METFKAEISKLEAQTKALRIMGWFETDGVWYSPLGAEMSFEEAIEFEGL